MPIRKEGELRHIINITNQVNLQRGDIVFYKKGTGKVVYATVDIVHAYDDCGRSFIIAIDQEAAEDWKYKVIETQRILFYIPNVLEYFLNNKSFLEDMVESLETAYTEEGE
jgi:hypothetical protein